MGQTDIDRLKKIYRLYDEQMASIDHVCREKCSTCCTCNVTLTGLEAALLIAGLTGQEKERMKKRIDLHFPEKRYIPSMTTNMFARLCVQGKELPEEENDPDWGKCPLLVDDLCSVYPHRPFGCRALMSQVNCSQKGYAQIPPMVLTLNNLFLQYIEHLDNNGGFGNLSDMLSSVLSGNSFHMIPTKALISRDDKFIPNEKITVLMIPPEHRQQLRGVVEELSGVVSA